MNIFFLDTSPKQAAKYHCKKHVIKMILETAQIFNTVGSKVGSEKVFYKPTHANHPSVKWAGISKGNFMWLVELFDALCEEYTSLTGKVHACESKVKESGIVNDVSDRLTGGLVAPFLVVDDENKKGYNYTMEDAVKRYRRYYATKDAFVRDYGKGRNIPEWLDNM